MMISNDYNGHYLAINTKYVQLKLAHEDVRNTLDREEKQNRFNEERLNIMHEENA